MPGGFRILPYIAEQVSHYAWSKQFRAAQRQTTHRAQLLLKLARHACVETEMPAVMRTRREFIDEDRVVGEKKHFHRQQTHEFEILRDCTGDLTRIRGDF